MASASSSGHVVNYENQTLIPSLPNDISVRILARLPRSHHPTLSLVSKAFHSLLSTPHFLNVRTLIDTTTEVSVFITLCSDDNPFTDHFYTLHRGHLVNLPPVPSCSADATYATLGPFIYVLGGMHSDTPSNDVWIFSCRLNKWARGPSMHVARKSPMVKAVDGKLYVKGGCGDEISTEAYDPDTGTWEEVDEANDFDMETWVAMKSLRIDEAYDIYVEEHVDVIREHKQYVANSLKVEYVEGKWVVFWEQKGKRKKNGEKEGLKDWEVRWMEIDVQKDKSEDSKGILISPCRCRIINCSVVAF